VIDLLDNLLRSLLLEQIAELTNEAQVRFQPPDADWRTFVANLTVDSQPANALNIYLVDLRENRKLRSNERVRSVVDGIVSEEPAPARLDCHYLISAWSPATVSPAVEPTLDEHALLYQAAAVLVRNGPFNPSRVYPAGSAALNAWPEPFRDAELPAMVLPVEGFNKLAEFWSGMGQGALWKPVLYLIVTLPIALVMEVSGPMVTTRITEYRFANRPETGEVLIEIGGQVLTPAPPLSGSAGSAVVTAIAGTTVTVNNAAPFRVGDLVTEDNTARATITQSLGNDLMLSGALVSLAVGDTLRVANTPPLPVAIGNAVVTGIVGPAITVNDSTPFRVGDVVTEDNTARATISQIVGTVLTLSSALAGLAAGDTLRIADLLPSQATFRLTDMTGLLAGVPVLISGDDAANPGNTVTDRAVVQSLSARGFVTLSDVPARHSTYNFNVAPASAPMLIPLGGTDSAWVRLEDPTGTALQTTTTDTVGRFMFAGLKEGNYILRVRVQGFAEATRSIAVPSLTGNYDVILIS
jgi:hypothetical protein